MENAIRKWTDSDVEPIVEAWIASLHDGGREDVKLRQNPDRALRRWLLERLKQPETFGLVAESEDDLAGFLMGRVTTWESEPPILAPRRIGVIEVVWVAERARRRGVGSKLVEEALAYAARRGVSVVETTYETGNPEAARMWKKLGFRPWMESVCRPTGTPSRKVGF